MYLVHKMLKFSYNKINAKNNYTEIHIFFPYVIYTDQQIGGHSWPGWLMYELLRYFKITNTHISWPNNSTCSCLSYIYICTSVKCNTGYQM